MRSRILRTFAVAVMLAAAPIAAFAQFGHPLKGQWSGEAGKAGNTTRLLLDLNWDGKAITGSLQEVTGAVDGGSLEADVKNVTIDYSKVTAWAVTMQADGKDGSGKAVQIRLDGTLENLGAYRRVFHGTLTQGTEKMPFTLTKN
jgi:hypothetical protein